MEEKKWYTEITDSIDEEDWAVMTATLSTGFAAGFLALLIGLIVGCCCCIKASRCYMCCRCLSTKQELVLCAVTKQTPDIEMPTLGLLTTEGGETDRDNKARAKE